MKTSKIFFSFGKKIGLLVSSVFVVSVMVLLIFVLSLYGKNMSDEFSERVISIGENLSAVIAGPLNAVVSISDEFTPEIIRMLNVPCEITVDKQKDIIYAVLLSNNQQVTNANKFGESAFLLPVGKETKKMLGKKYLIHDVETFKTKIHEVRIPVKKEEKSIGEIALGYSDKRIENLISNTVSLSVSIALLCLGITIIVVFVFIKLNVTNPLINLRISASVLAERAGDLTQKIAVTANDEIGQLSEVFNKIIESMHDMVAQVRGTSEKVAISSQQLSASSQEINATTQEFSGAVQQVSKGSVIQSERTKEASGLSEEALITLKQMVGSAQAAGVAVNQTFNQVDSGRSLTVETVEKINRLTNTITNTAGIIRGLGEKSQQIGEITEAITSIADQTNLLALNAAIEAARAGEAGRGFAVVAEEVRKLAENSAGAVRKISGLIKSIQDETGNAVKAMEVSFNEMQEGKKQVSKIKELLEDLNKASKEATLLMQSIEKSGQKQVQDTARVVTAVDEAAEIAQGTVSTIGEVSASIEEQTASMEEMTASAQEVANLAMELKNMVVKFKLRDTVM